MLSRKPSPRKRLAFRFRNDDHPSPEVLEWVRGRIDGLSAQRTPVGQSHPLLLASREIHQHLRVLGSHHLPPPPLPIRLQSLIYQGPIHIIAQDSAVTLSSIKRKRGSWSRSPIRAIGTGSRSQLPISKGKAKWRRMIKSRRGDVSL
jgi:hypothetical protein